jgi:hypothetical protein
LTERQQQLLAANEQRLAFDRKINQLEESMNSFDEEIQQSINDDLQLSSNELKDKSRFIQV